MIENEQEGDTLSSSVFKNIPRKQKVAVFALAAGAVAIIVFWAWEFNTRLASSFTSPNEKKISTVKSNTNSSSTDLVSLKTVDTDHDGLTDYDEINIYHTSPYLEDTDSDGISDFEEVKNGTDPNCPSGKVCNGADSIKVSASTTPASSINVPSLSIPADMASSSKQTLEKALNGTVDAKTLRELLINSGADKTMLDQISDDVLMKSYQQTLKNKQ